jgi:hypothetical protein
LVNLVTTGAISADGAVAALAALAGAGSTRLQIETGRLIAALPSAGATPAALVADIETAIAAQAITVAQAIVIGTAAALSGSAALASAVGGDIGAMIAAGRITVADALADIQTADGAYGVNDATNEALLLIAAAGATAPGLQVAAGGAIAALLNRGVIGVGATIAAIDGAVGASGGLSAGQAVSVLIGVAQGSSLQVQVAVGGELDALVAAGKLGASDVILALDQAIRATTLSATAGFAVLLSAASNSAAMVVPVTNELAALIGEAVVTPDQALSALFAGAGAQDFAFMPANTDATLAAIVTALVARHWLTAAQVVTDLNAAASGTPVISAKHAVGVLLDLAADTTDPAAAQAYAAALSSLIAGGVGAAALADNLLADVAAGSMSPGQAVTILAGIVGAAPAGQAASLQALIGATVATLVNNGSLTVAQLIVDLQTAVSSGTLGANGGVGLIAETASSLSSAVNGSALPVELIRLIETGAAPASQVFADIEAVAAAAGVSFDHGFGLLIADIAATTDAALQAAVAVELASLISRSIITATQAANYVAQAVSGALSADTAVLLLSAGISSVPVAGASVAALVNNGTITLSTVFGDLQAEVAGGALSLDGEIRLIAALANNLTGAGSLTALSTRLIQLVQGGVPTSQVFTDISAVAQSAGSFSQALGVLLAGMAGTADTGLQNAVGQQLGSLVAGGSITAAAALADITAAVTSGQLTSGQAQVAQVAATGSGGPAVQAAVGQQFGGQLASQNSASAVSGVLSTLLAQFSGGTLTVTQLVAVLTGMGTVAYSAPNGGTAVAAGSIAQLVLSGQLTLNQAAADLQNIQGGNIIGASAVAQEVALLNPQVLAGTLSSFDAFNTFQNSFYPNYYQTHYGFDPDLARQAQNRDDDRLFSTLRVILGDQLQFGVDNELTRLVTAIAPASLLEASAAVNSFANSGALAAASQLIALITSGQISASAAMAAVDTAAPFVDATRLVYFLASLAAAPSLQVLAPQEIDALVHAGRLTGTAALATIAAITNAVPSGGSSMVSIVPSTAVSVLIGVYSNAQIPAFAAAIAQQIAGIFTNPTAGYTKAAELAAINGAVSGNLISATVATNLLLQLAVAAQLPPTSASFATIIADISSYIAQNGVPLRARPQISESVIWFL